MMSFYAQRQKLPTRPGEELAEILYNMLGDFLSLILARLRLDFYPLIQIRLQS